MEDMDLLVCMIETEITKIRYQMKIVYAQGRKSKYKALLNKMSGLKETLGFIEEIERMEEMED